MGSLMAKGDVLVVHGGVRCRIVKVWPFGTYDVVTLDGKRAFRVTGLYGVEGVKKGPCDACGRNACDVDEVLCPACKAKHHSKHAGRQCKDRGDGCCFVCGVSLGPCHLCNVGYHELSCAEVGR